MNSKTIKEAFEEFGIYIANQYGGFEGYEDEDYEKINELVDELSLPQEEQ